MINIINQKEHGVSQEKEFEDLSISIAIVNYNAGELLRACLASIEGEQPYEVVVIDNASTDGSGEMIRRDFPRVHVINMPRNDGYGAAANLAIASCSSQYVLLLNCDTSLHPGTLQILCDYLDQYPRAAVVGPRLVNPDGTRQPSCFPFPTPLQTLIKETSLSRLSSGYGSPPSARRVPWVLGAALAIRKSAFESVGGFDASFFMYFEEVDLCYRLREAGWETHFAPAAIVTHVGGASTRKQRPAMLLQLYKSLCHFYRLHYAPLQRSQLKLVLTYLMSRSIFKELFKKIYRPRAGDDLIVWRTILSSVWSSNGWLKS